MFQGLIDADSSYIIDDDFPLEFKNMNIKWELVRRTTGISFPERVS